MLRTRKLATAAIAGLLLAVTACSSQGGAQNEPGATGPAGGSNTGGPRFTIAMITHEAPGATFWDRVRAGAEQAAANLNVELRYSNDISAPNQATLVQNAIDSRPDGIAVTLAFPEAVGPVLAGAAQAGIPTVAFNSGIDVYQQYGALMYFGSDESVAGESAGARIARAGGGKALCVVHEQGNSSLETRCAGVTKSFPNTENLQVNGSDLPSVQQTIGAKLAQDPSITDIVTLDAGIAGAAVAAKSSAGSQAKIVTFDLSAEVVQAIQDKQIEFSVDQQPYLQGYLAVESLWLQLTNGNEIGGGRPVLTGPSFVDASNIDKIANFAANNTR
jgi:simple sugar transport system substrate-binding protein